MSDSPAAAAPVVACAGILVADIFVPPLERLPAAGSLVATDDFLLESGGCAANVATVLAALGVASSVCGVVGEDVFGGFLEARLAGRGIDTAGIRRDIGGTSKTVILTVAGEDRRFVHTFGANARFRSADLSSPSVGGAAILYVGGYLVLPALNPDEAATALAAAQARGTVVVLDVVAPAGSACGLEPLMPVLPYVDVFMPNEDEARALTGISDPQAQAACFVEAGCRSAVITRGSRGTLVAEPGGTWSADAYPIDFVDGSGAGDAFAAGYIAGLVEGWDPVRRLQFASACGALACTRLGCAAGVTGRSAVEDLIARHRLEVRCSKGDA